MILVALLLAAFLVNLDTTLVNVALPAMVRELHATNAFLRGLTIAALVAGAVAAAGALLAVLFLPAQPTQPARLTRPAQPADQPVQAPAQTAGATAD
jgi:MFS family permease